MYLLIDNPRLSPDYPIEAVYTNDINQHYGRPRKVPDQGSNNDENNDLLYVYEYPNDGRHVEWFLDYDNDIPTLKTRQRREASILSNRDSIPGNVKKSRLYRNIMKMLNIYEEKRLNQKNSHESPAALLNRMEKIKSKYIVAV